MALSYHLLVSLHVTEQGSQPLLMTDDPWTQGADMAALWAQYAYFKCRSKLRLEKVEDTAAASHLLHILRAQGILSNNYLGAGVTTVVTVQK